MKSIIKVLFLQTSSSAIEQDRIMSISGLLTYDKALKNSDSVYCTNTKHQIEICHRPEYACAIFRPSRYAANQSFIFLLTYPEVVILQIYFFCQTSQTRSKSVKKKIQKKCIECE